MPSFHIDRTTGAPHFIGARYRADQRPHWKSAGTGNVVVNLHGNVVGKTVDFDIIETATGDGRDVAKRAMFSLGTGELRQLVGYLNEVLTLGDPIAVEGITYPNKPEACPHQYWFADDTCKGCGVRRAYHPQA